MNLCAPNSRKIYETTGKEEPPLQLEREALHYDFRDYDDDYFLSQKHYELFDADLSTIKLSLRTSKYLFRGLMSF